MRSVLVQSVEATSAVAPQLLRFIHCGTKEHGPSSVAPALAAGEQFFELAGVGSAASNPHLWPKYVRRMHNKKRPPIFRWGRRGGRELSSSGASILELGQSRRPDILSSNHEMGRAAGEGGNREVLAERGLKQSERGRPLRG